jgi:hypothetical protein
MPITIGGLTYDVPDVYGYIQVKRTGGIALPSFQNILFIGKAKKGMPFNATGKIGSEIIKAFNSVTDVEEYYGNSDLSVAYNYAKMGGAGVAYFVNVAPLTLASATLKDDAGTPVATMTVTPKDKFYGAAGNDISVTVGVATDDVTFTIIPPKFTKFLSANGASSGLSVTLEDVSGLNVGQSVKMNDNAAAAPEVLTIASINTDTKVVTFTTALTANHTTANYARIFVEDTDNQEVKTFDSTSATFVQDALAWINGGQILNATRGDTQTGDLATAVTKVYLQNVASATKGTSPDPTETASGDYDDCAAALPALIESFSNYTGVRLRLFSLLTSNSAVHAVYKALAATMRNVPMQMSIQVISGCATGDVALASSEANNSINRAKALNTDEFLLAAFGLDDLPAYLSLAPQVAGIMSINGVGHNLTNDVISATKVEKHLGLFNQETETAPLLRAGLLVVKTGIDGFKLVQGLNTYQWRNSIWNEVDKKTYLVRERQIVDYIYEAYRIGMKIGVGADNYTPDIAIVQGNEILKQFVGLYISEYKITRAYKVGNAVHTEFSIKIINTTDFIGFTMTVEVSDN